MSAPSELLGLDPEQLARRLSRVGLPAWRGGQLFHAIQRQHVDCWSTVTTLPKEMRERIDVELPLSWPTIAQRFTSRDGTVRYLLRLEDGESVEAVFLPDEIFDARGRTVRHRATFCISTQVGCPVNCQFCLTALLGLKRNLSAGEIVAQVSTLLREHQLEPGTAGGDRVNVVYMGQGEPFLNYDNVMQSVRVLTHPAGVGLSPRRITISTSGIVEKIRRFGGVANRPRLAISLNATTDEMRTRLMPLNPGQGGIAALIAAAREFPLSERERLTFEYVLLQDVNDSLADADRLARLVANIRCKVNLIAWNMGPELEFRRPGNVRVRRFQQRLGDRSIPAFIRRPRGADIYAACGQLKKASASAPLVLL